MLLTIVFVFVVTILFYVFFNKKARDAGRKFPGPKTLPLIGNGLEISKGGSIGFFEMVNKYWAIYGTRFRVFLGPNLCVVVSNAKDVEVILSNHQYNEKSSEYEYIKPWLGTGLLTSKGEKWYKHRKVITPTFHFKILENFLQVFDSQSDTLIRTLKKYENKGNFDVFPRVTLCALDIICEAAMGVSVNAQDDEESEYVTAVKDMLRIIHSRMKNPFRRLDIFFRFTSDYHLQKKSLQILHKFTNDMIKRRRTILEQSNENFTSYTEGSELLGVKKKMAFLDMLLLSTIDGQPLDDISIREEVDTFLFEGHDTTTSAISFALYSIANNPEVQDKLYKEQQEIFFDDVNRSSTYSDLQNMKYMELVIKEVLRLYPSVPLIARKISENSVINGTLIPKDSTALILVYNLHRNPEVFKNPESFIPERFLPEEANKRHPFSIVSFSAGARNCIGQKFAMLEMKSTLSKILRNYKLESSGEKLILTIDIILKSVNGVQIQISPRN